MELKCTTLIRDFDNAEPMHVWEQRICGKSLSSTHFCCELKKAL